MTDSPFYVELLSDNVNSYELKKFRVQHDETQLVKYLSKLAKKHNNDLINRTYLVREIFSKNIVAFFSLKAATLPYNDKEEVFLIPAVELTHFAVDERYKNAYDPKDDIRVGEFIFWNHIYPLIYEAQEKIAIKDLFIFSINNPNLLNYYKNRLGFKEIKNIDDKIFFDYAQQPYEEDCKFLYFPIEELTQEN